MPNRRAASDSDRRRLRWLRRSLLLGYGAAAALAVAWALGVGLERTASRSTIARPGLAEPTAVRGTSGEAILVAAIPAHAEPALSDSRLTGPSQRLVAVPRSPQSPEEIVAWLEADHEASLRAVFESLQTDVSQIDVGDLQAVLGNLEATLDDEYTGAELASIGESLRTSQPTESGETFFVGGQTSLRGVDFHAMGAGEPATQD